MTRLKNKPNSQGPDLRGNQIYLSDICSVGNHLMVIKMGDLGTITYDDDVNAGSA